MLTPKTNSLICQIQGVLRVMNGALFFVWSTSFVFRHSGTHLKSSFSQTRERLVIGPMSTREQDTTLSGRSPMAKARPSNLVSQGQCKEDVSSQGSGSPVNPVNDYNRKRVSPATGNRGGSSSNAEVGSSQVYRQEMANLAARKLGQKDFTRPKSRRLS